MFAGSHGGSGISIGKSTPVDTYWKNWGPRLGFAYRATNGDRPLVIRGGYSLRRFTEPYQYYWNNVSSQGAFFYQNFALNPNNTGTTGTFAPTGSRAVARSGPTVTLLRDGRVLVAGGAGPRGGDVPGPPLDSAELFVP